MDKKPEVKTNSFFSIKNPLATKELDKTMKSQDKTKSSGKKSPKKAYETKSKSSKREAAEARELKKNQEF